MPRYRFLSQDVNERQLRRKGGDPNAETLEVHPIQVYEVDADASALEDIVAFFTSRGYTLLDTDGYVEAETIDVARHLFLEDTLDAYVSGPGAAGQVAYFTDPKTIAGDNDMVFNTVDGRLEVTAFQLSTDPTDGYVLTSNDDGVASWQSIADIGDFLDSKGKSFNFTLNRPGNSGNKWAYHSNNSSATDETPIHFGFDVSLISISFINKNPNTFIDIEFYKNGTTGGDLIYTETISDGRRHIHTQATSIFDLDLGDRLSIFLSKIGSDTPPNDTVIELLFVIRTDDVALFTSNNI